MMDFEIKVDEKRLAEIQRFLANIPRALPQVMSRAINRTATTVRAKMVRDIAAKIALKQKDIREGITIRKATYGRWSAEISLSRKRKGLIHFAASNLKKSGRGVSYVIEKARGRKTIPHAFVATSKNAENVWIRKEGPDGKLVGRLPIRRLKGPSIGEVWRRSAPLVMSTYANAQEVLEKNIDSQIAFVLSKAQTNIGYHAADMVHKLSQLHEAA